jgi:hypothetical protein
MVEGRRLPQLGDTALLRYGVHSHLLIIATASASVSCSSSYLAHALVLNTALILNWHICKGRFHFYGIAFVGT